MVGSTGDDVPGTHAGREGPRGRREDATGRTTYEDVRDSPEFVALRRRFRRFVLPVSALFLVWYATYVLLAD